jgi:SulP family sulfate permease
MFTALKKILINISEFTPKSWICLKEGYTKESLFHDVMAGITVGIISLPLTMAFAIASGLGPERGLYTGIIAGFIISLLGGSRVQIGGPTGAFVVIIYSAVERHGYEGLALATLIAGFFMIILAIARAGVLLKFIPYPVTTGFTAAIALNIFSSQVKDLFGLPLSHVPADFIEKWTLYFEHFSGWNPHALTLGLISLGLIFFLRSFFPKVPGAVVVVALGGLAVYFLHIPVETIQTKFGAIPNHLEFPTLPFFSLEKIQAVFPDAIAITLLGSIESLLSAVVADGMTGHRHRSNTELFAQGIANIASSCTGGIPATGAIARTAANVKLGAKTPLAGMIHSITLLIFILFFGALAVEIPLPVLAAILTYIAWNMSERAHIVAICKGPRSEILVLTVTFTFTVLFDLTVALQAGVILSAILFLKNMTDTTSVKVAKLILEEERADQNQDSDLILRTDVPEGVAIFEMNGPLFFGSALALSDQLYLLRPDPEVFILRLHKVPLIDTSGIQALKEFAATCKKRHITFLISGVHDDKKALFAKTGLDHEVGKHNLYPHFQQALEAAKRIKALKTPEHGMIKADFFAR